MLHAQNRETFIAIAEVQYESSWQRVQCCLHGKTPLAGLEPAFASVCDAVATRLVFDPCHCYMHDHMNRTQAFTVSPGYGQMGDQCLVSHS